MQVEEHPRASAKYLPSLSSLMGELEQIWLYLTRKQ